MNDFNWEDREWRSIWTSYEIWPEVSKTAREPDIRTEKSVATIDDLKRKFGVS